METTSAIYGLLLVAFYFLPTIIANVRGHINRTPVLLLNLFLGWTLLGWIGALIWSATANTETPAKPRAKVFE
ncbi:superinfection immunity protein [Paraburkholderia oxyphila]|uniref:superinfection immunity protein n=1 Tax=Paraburkholderia oxyphila TaxID=614212 RepID=UPI000481797C|nr:superinfection immunity protein [Paraburkholderia oxyphila]